MSVATTWPAGPDALREPLRERAVARADFQAMPTRRNADALEMKTARRVEQIRHQAEPVAFAFQIVLPDVLGHGRLGVRLTLS